MIDRKKGKSLRSQEGGKKREMAWCLVRGGKKKREATHFLNLRRGGEGIEEKKREKGCHLFGWVGKGKTGSLR